VKHAKDESLLRIAAVIALLITPTLIPTTLHSSFGQEEQQQDDDVAPSPPSIGADIPLTYFGPAPSTVQKELVDPLQLLRSHINSNP
jgi:hypothetical protein